MQSDTREYRQRQLQYFLLMPREQQAEAIRRLAASGMHDATIAAATGLSVEQVRRIIAEGAAQ